MLLTELKANLKDYVYMFKDSSIALRYLYGKCGGRTYSYYAGSKVIHNPRITDARFREVVEAIHEEIKKMRYLYLKDSQNRLVFRQKILICT